MNKNLKIYLILGPTLMSFIYGFTSPIVEIYFMKLVSAQILAMANMLSIGLSAIIQTTVPCAWMKRIYINNFTMIVVVNVICFCSVSFLSTEYTIVRFLGFAILHAMSINLWVVILKDAINKVLSGEELTNWSSFSRSFELYGSLAGCALALVLTEVNVFFCIFLQCVANIIMGYTDLVAFKKLNQQKLKHECSV